MKETNRMSKEAYSRDGLLRSTMHFLAHFSISWMSAPRTEPRTQFISVLFNMLHAQIPPQWRLALDQFGSSLHSNTYHDAQSTAKLSMCDQQ